VISNAQIKSITGRDAATPSHTITQVKDVISLKKILLSEEPDEMAF
tara:strand:- start:393 stop:530 length:138 start_codon:yes stop_codon:yes gene_type:complete